MKVLKVKDWLKQRQSVTYIGKAGVEWIKVESFQGFTGGLIYYPKIIMTPPNIRTNENT